jgi:hypothetical protein
MKLVQRSLPAPLPQGERVLWQGRPDWRVLARRAFHVRGAAIYFALLAAWRAGTALDAGAPVSAIYAVLLLGGLGAIACGLLLFLAYINARASLFTITTGRVLLRTGAAITRTADLPFAALDSADVRLNPDGSGDIAFVPSAGQRLSWLVLWPYVRNGRGRAEPLLRALPDAAAVADIVARAMAQASGQPAPVRLETPAPAAAETPVQAAA